MKKMKQKGPALSRAEMNEYIASGGNFCPFCGDTEINSTSSFEADGDSAWRYVECSACGKTWCDVYTLTGLEYKK